MTPPVSGPNRAGMITKFIARRMPDFGKVLSSAIRPTGIIKAAPKPWMIREVISIGRLVKSPQASEPRLKASLQKVKKEASFSQKAKERVELKSRMLVMAASKREQ